MKEQSATSDKRFFVPNFCHVQSVFLVVLMAELLAILLSLARFDFNSFWFILGRYSLFIQWVALISAGALCTLRPWLRGFSNIRAGVISYGLILAITFVAALIAQWLESYLGNVSLVIDWSILSYNMMVAAILSAFWLRLFYLQAQYRVRLETEADARLQALQARIKPHFLFNSMNILSSLIPIKPELAEQVVDDLSGLFRASLTDHKQEVSVQEEVAICDQYLRIESLRLGNRLTVNWQLDGDLRAWKLPPLTLQPLIENAVYHGIQPIVEGGTIHIAITAEDVRLKIMIRNPFKADKLPSVKGHQVAIQNIQDRLGLLYGDGASFKAVQGSDEYHVEIEIKAGVKGESTGR